MYGELVIFLELSFIINSILLNITFGNRHNLAKLIEHSIEIDILLGVKETKFMRDIADTAYTIMGVPVVVVQLSIFAGIMCIAIGSLLCVQTIITYGKTGMDIMRQYIIVSWLVLSWLFILAISLLVDIFSRQIEQTTLICTYAQLESINNEAVYKFTKSIFRALENRVARASIYGVFFFDPGMMLRLAASTFVYITAQLQISMPATEGNYSSGNLTLDI
ncbi:hypothetical protein ABMA27_016066 [Loxostege sticticalis]|uniref:Gustatory receptor n=1 Tax=Loxostege sticticalis TaxID=481309 RepID=A0ABR3I5D1_LOXSC